MLKALKRAKKTVAAVVTGLLGWGAQVVVSDPAHITAGEWIALGTVLAIALGVYNVTNVSPVKRTRKRAA